MTDLHQPPPEALIDDRAHIRNRDRAAANFDQFDFLKQAVTERIMDRMIPYGGICLMSWILVAIMAC